MKNLNEKSAAAAGHTPGPWIVSSDKKAVRAGADIMNNYRRNVVNIGKRDNAEEMAANLALCAAAPELLAALESLVDWAGKGEGREEYDFVQLARAAIAKAERAKKGRP